MICLAFTRSPRNSWGAVGDIVDLDGIDGFFDQYFAGEKEGEIIEFVCLGPSNCPTTLEKLLDLPFFTAEIVEDHYDWARGRLLEISTLRDWSSRVREPSLLNQLTFPIPLPTDLPALIGQAQASGSAYWYSTMRYQRTMCEVTAIGALADSDSTALWVVTTNAGPNYFVRVT